MAWVTLSLRKMELIHQHNELEFEDLQISREERQMARQYQLLERRARNEGSMATRQVKESYRSNLDNLNSQYADDKGNMQYQQEYNTAKENYDEEINQLKKKSQ